MIISLCSDLHLEMYKDRGKGFIESLDPTDIDVLVLAGDICSFSGATATLSAFAKKYKQVVYVTGNHEFYGTNPATTALNVGAVAGIHENFHWLDGSTATIDGVRFVGGTLWFLDEPRVRGYRSEFSDFKYIKNFDPWVYETNGRHRMHFWKDLQEGDVLVTHHLPSYKSVHPKYAAETVGNNWFVCPIDDLIEEKKPALALHGHTHERVDYTIGPTRVLCNPRGYPFEQPTKFDPRLLIEV